MPSKNVRAPLPEEVAHWTDAERAEYQAALESHEPHRSMVLGIVVTKNRAAHAPESWPQDELAVACRKQIGDGREVVRGVREMLQDPRATSEDKLVLEAMLQRMRENGVAVDDA
jgi:hypothetical protein